MHDTLHVSCVEVHGPRCGCSSARAGGGDVTSSSSVRLTWGCRGNTRAVCCSRELHLRGREPHHPCRRSPGSREREPAGYSPVLHGLPRALDIVDEMLSKPTCRPGLWYGRLDSRSGGGKSRCGSCRTLRGPYRHGIVLGSSGRGSCRPPSPEAGGCADGGRAWIGTEGLTIDGPQ